VKVPFCNLVALNAMVKPELAEAYARVMTRGRYILDVEVEAFEGEWAAYCHKTHAVGVGNGLDALALMLRAYGIGRGDEVIVPANTYVATWLAVSATGAVPVPCDPHPDTMNLHNIASALTDKTRAILAVHLYGRPCDMKYLRGWAEELEIPLLVDACQGHGIKGSDLGDAAAFSFYPTKNLGCLGDGGAVVTNDDAVARYVRMARNYGSLHKNVHDFIGYNSRLDELQAAFLRAKLPLLDRFNRLRRDHAMDLGGDGEGVNHHRVIRSKHRVQFQRSLHYAGIETLIHYPTPPHLQHAYAHLGYKAGAFPVTEQLAREVVSLPIGPELSLEQVRYVHDHVWVTA